MNGLPIHIIRRKPFKTNNSTNFYSIQIAISTRYKLTVLSRELQCYNRVSPLTNRAFCVPNRVAGHKSRATDHAISSRQPGRLDTSVTRRKQTLATRLNRQLSRRFAHHPGAPDRQLSTANFELRLTTNHSHPREHSAHIREAADDPRHRIVWMDLVFQIYEALVLRG